jgi:hypothetical protein
MNTIKAIRFTFATLTALIYQDAFAATERFEQQFDGSKSIVATITYARKSSSKNKQKDYEFEKTTYYDSKNNVIARLEETKQKYPMQDDKAVICTSNVQTISLYAPLKPEKKKNMNQEISPENVGGIYIRRTTFSNNKSQEDETSFSYRGEKSIGGGGQFNARAQFIACMNKDYTLTFYQKGDQRYFQNEKILDSSETVLEGINKNIKEINENLPYLKINTEVWKEYTDKPLKRKIKSDPIKKMVSNDSELLKQVIFDSHTYS